LRSPGVLVEVLGLIWIGTRTDAFTATAEFFGSKLGLPVGRRRPHFVRFDLADWGSIEVFDAASDEYPHFTHGPVLGFAVTNLEESARALERQGYPLLLPPGGERGGYRWQHFQGPDDCVFEIVEYPDRPRPRAPVGPLRLTGIVWMGLSTARFEATAAFYKETLRLPVVEETADLIECRLPDGSSVEAFRRGSEIDHPHFRTGPVPGLGVVDIDEAMRGLAARGVGVIQARRRAHGGWAHFRAPDGNVYEVKQGSEAYRW
jgi:catechol 2,3-dioxygenase-like lactoylglutathione lyase family enzyme